MQKYFWTMQLLFSKESMITYNLNNKNAAKDLHYLNSTQNRSNRQQQIIKKVFPHKIPSWIDLYFRNLKRNYLMTSFKKYVIE